MSISWTRTGPVSRTTTIRRLRLAEFSLATGVYLIKAAGGAGRLRGPADFTLFILRAANCDPVDLGRLTPGVGLTADGAWILGDRETRSRERRPAHTSRFDLPQRTWSASIWPRRQAATPQMAATSWSGDDLQDGTNRVCW